MEEGRKDEKDSSFLDSLSLAVCSFSQWFEFFSKGNDIVCIIVLWFANLVQMPLPASLLSREIGVVESFQIIVLLFWSKLLLFLPNLNSRFIESRCYTKLDCPIVNKRFCAKRTDNHNFSSSSSWCCDRWNCYFVRYSDFTSCRETMPLANYWRLCQLDSFEATLLHCYRVVISLP